VIVKLAIAIKRCRDRGDDHGSAGFPLLRVLHSNIVFKGDMP
jgi:hypothetical protein